MLKDGKIDLMVSNGERLAIEGECGELVLDPCSEDEVSTLSQCIVAAKPWRGG